MKRGPNNEVSYNSSSERRFTLPKRKILRGRSNFQQLFTDQAVCYYRAAVNIRFRIYQNNTSAYKMAFIVPKRLGKANRRNRVKRLLKEAYRHNQYIVADTVKEALCTFHGAFLATTIDVEYDEVERNVTDLLHQAKSYIDK